MNRLIPATLLIVFSFSVFVSAQQSAVRPSQLASLTQQMGKANITIKYSRPVAKGRVLFGPSGIVKFDKIWMPGANEASTIEFDADVVFENKPLPKGKYSFWTIPAEKNWTLILSRDWDQWHTAYPGKDEDAIRVDISQHEGAHMETLAFYFPVVKPDSVVLKLHWGTTVIPMNIRVD